MHQFPVTIEVDEDGFYVVDVPDLPGCSTSGRTREEALANIKDAILACIEAHAEWGQPIDLAPFEAGKRELVTA